MAASTVDAPIDHSRDPPNPPISALSREILGFIFEYVSRLRIISEELC